MNDAPIPVFGLYGEDSPEFLVPFVHVETIAERSVLHDWEIAPHRHMHNLQVLLVLSGRVAVTLGRETRELDAPCAIAIPPSLVHGFRFSANTHGYVASFSAEILSRFASPGDPLPGLLAQSRMGPLSGDEAARAGRLAEELLALTARWDADRRLVEALLESLLRTLVKPEGAALSDPRLARFRQLVEQHFREHRPVGFYAREIGMTPRSLTRLCRNWLDRTPQQVLAGRLAGEATRMLRDGSANAAQVSDALGFCDPSYFSRFYKRTTGLTPRQAMTG